LIRQYWRYGFWKFKMLRRYPQTLRWRQALPPALALGVIGGALIAWIPFMRALWLGGLGIYIGALFAAGLLAALKHKQAALSFGLPLAVAAMHLSWGGGFLWSLVSRGRID
jgi:hypothetical protein